MTMGGHASEVLTFGEMSTGPSNDIQQATETARRMVTQYGMSPKLGPRAFGRREELVFLGRDIAEQRNYSERVAEAIDAEVSHLIDDAHRRAMEILARHEELVEMLSERLIEVETLDAEEFTRLISTFGDQAPVVSDTTEPATQTDVIDDDASPRELPPTAKQQPAEGTI